MRCAGVQAKKFPSDGTWWENDLQTQTADTSKCDSGVYDKLKAVLWSFCLLSEHSFFYFSISVYENYHFFAFWAFSVVKTNFSQANDLIPGLANQPSHIAVSLSLHHSDYRHFALLTSFENGSALAILERVIQLRETQQEQLL
jgi:hypothetical protein